jgi:hypothetical protein
MLTKIKATASVEPAFELIRRPLQLDHDLWGQSIRRRKASSTPIQAQAIEWLMLEQMKRKHHMPGLAQGQGDALFTRRSPLSVRPLDPAEPEEAEGDSRPHIAPCSEDGRPGTGVHGLHVGQPRPRTRRAIAFLTEFAVSTAEVRLRRKRSSPNPALKYRGQLASREVVQRDRSERLRRASAVGPQRREVGNFPSRTTSY